MMAPVLSLVLGLAAADEPSPQPQPQPRTIVVKVGRLFDGTGEVARHDQVVVIEGDRKRRSAWPVRCRCPRGRR
jgi:hypothetical protein